MKESCKNNWISFKKLYFCCSDCLATLLIRVLAKSEINKLGLVITQNWVSQVVSSLGGIFNRNINTVGHGKVWIKSWYNSKHLYEYCWIFLCDFWSQTVLILPDQNVWILLICNMCNRNIETFWHRKLCMKRWYGSKSLWILPLFFYDVLGPKCQDTLNIHTVCMLHFSLINLQAPSQFRLVSFLIGFVEFKTAGLSGCLEFKQFSIPRLGIIFEFGF